MIKYFILTFFFILGNTEWLLVYKTFTGTTISNTAWSQIKTCTTNQLQYAVMSYQYSEILYDNFISYKGFKVQVIFDMFLDNADPNYSTQQSFHLHEYSSDQRIYFLQQYYVTTHLQQMSNRICTGGGNYAFRFVTFSTTIAIDTNYFHFHFDTNIPSSMQYSEFMGFRNVMIYVNACFPRCQTCQQGILNNQCTSCYYGITQNGSCNCNPQHQFAMTSIGCLQECPRGYLFNFDFICIPDNRIQAYTQYFTSNVIQSSNIPLQFPFSFIKDPLQQNIQPAIKTDCIFLYNFIGLFKYYQGISLQMNSIEGLKFIRLRITLLLFSLQIDSAIAIFCDGMKQSQIRKSTVAYEYIQLTNIFTKSSIACNEDAIRLELVFHTASLNPNILIQGYLIKPIESWGFFNITIDAGFCQTNCQVCSNFDICSQCNAGYLLYQNSCVLSCPIHSSNCIDYSDLYPYSTYLAKGFYNLNMTLDDIQYYYDSATNTGTNFLTGQKFGFFPDKFVLGGLMVWYDATYSKTFSINQPHYAISIRFNFTFGDEYPGEFFYHIESISYGPFTLPISIAGQNLLGKTNNEITQFFYNYINPHTSNSLSIQFQCIAPASFDIRDGFCAISEYFIVVHYCQPFCAVCSSATTCSSWIPGYTSSNCATNEFISFDQSTSSFSCKTCTQIGCLTCNSLDECTSCIYTETNKFYLSQGVCYCSPFTYLSGIICTNCNIYCENCYGPNSSNCVSCVQEFHRVLQKRSCVCQTGYYDDGHNLQCQPICGDQLIVDGEDCDDGNFNPFDGCDQCMFACGEMCSICVQGICESDNNEYIFGNNCCLQEVNDIIQVYNQNEDYSQYLCSIHCNICYFGLCELCNQGFLNYNGFCYEINNQMDNKLSKLENYFSEYFCQPNCDICYFGLCELCNQGFQNQNGFCYEINNQKDNKLSKLENYFSEYFCQPNCDICYFGLCELCNQGFQNQNGFCYEINNQKDNKLSKLENYFSEYFCQPNCNICYFGLCELCNQGFQNQNGFCYEINNQKDNKLSKFEYYFSEYFCQPNCNICHYGLCELCNQGFLNQNGFCYEINNQKDNKLSKLEYYFSEYFCQPNCDICYFGSCELCNDDLENINGVCQEINISFISFIFLLKFNILEEQDIQNTYLQYRSEHSKNFCPSNCLVCYEGLCLQCNSASGYGYLDIESNSCQRICGDGKVSVNEECDDGSIILHHECFNCKNQCSNKCELCIFDKCTQCNYGYYLHENMNQCISYCGDQLIANNEDCDDGNQDISDGCVDCKFVCHQQCTTCVDGRCYQCSGLGWKLNQVTKNCETVCGDKFVTGNEQCDDGNDFPEDGCYECAFECQKECEVCTKGSCSRCIKGWKTDDKQMCFPFCGDSYVLPGIEECDDGNETPYDGCFQCKYQCQEQCTDCQKGICYECKVTGWDIYNHICFPVCGDGIVINGYEQCDDSNDEQYDGCDSCFYQCEQLCTSCQLGICLECNHLGWIITKNKCTPYCGDGLIKGYEQCDDMNTDENDGCYECKFKCDEYCIDCQEGICFQCEIGRRILQTKLNRCETECGDGIYVQLTEQCDDGNDYNKDGCNAKCQIEKDWTCINTVNKISTCFYSQYPEIVLTLVSKSPSNIEVVNLAFSQQMKRSANISGDILNYVIANITNMQRDQYLISKEINQQITTDEITDVLIILTIEFYQSVDDPILNVTIMDDPFISQYGQVLIKNDEILPLLTPAQASDSTKSLALSTQKFNKTVIYILVALSSLCLITGSSDLFWNLLDQLQYLSYIKYINIDFPLNLNIYFEVFKMITISPLLQALKIDQLFAMLDGDGEYNISMQGKLLQDGINAYFWINFQSFLFCIISSLLVYLVTKQFCVVLYKIRLPPYCRLNFTISNCFHKLRKTCKKQTRQYFYNGILRVVMSNWYDLSFAVNIQLAYSGSDDNAIRINYYLAMFILSLQFGIIVFYSRKNSCCNKGSIPNKEKKICYLIRRCYPIQKYLGNVVQCYFTIKEVNIYNDDCIHVIIRSFVGYMYYNTIDLFFNLFDHQQTTSQLFRILQRDNYRDCTSLQCFNIFTVCLSR